MLLPTTYFSVLLLLIGWAACWGSWANAQKLAGKWRFELYYYDYATGVLLLGLLAAFTLGEFSPKDLTFSDNLLIASKRQMAWAVASGTALSLANLLLAAAVSVSGMSVAFPIAIGLAAVIGTVWTFAGNFQGSTIMLFGGALLLLIAAVVNAIAYSGYRESKRAQAIAALQPDPRARKKLQAEPGAARGIALAVVSGIVMGFFRPLIEMATEGDGGVAPYGTVLLMSGGMLVAALVLLPFFMAFPIQGDPVEFAGFFRGTRRQHLWGLLGGVIWGVGALCSLAAKSASGAAQAGTAAVSASEAGGAVIAALWGWTVWRDFNGAQLRARLLILIMLVLFIVGSAMISIAPLHGR